MASSAINIISEASRASANRDVLFYTKPVYFFELRVPAEVGVVGTSFLFPLALNPQEITMDEPFTVEATPTQGGGLYVEENGIVQRMLRIRGHTGFKPRKLEATAGLGFILKPEKASFGRQIPPVIANDLGTDAVGKGLSGQRHFQWLQDKVFRTYADLKRDPTTALDTKLIWHNQKDDEHWVVVPKQFTMTKQASRPVTYEYNIELLVVDKADSADIEQSEDKGLIDKLKDKIRQIQGGIDLARGAVADVTAAVGEIRSIVGNVDQILDSVNQVADAASAFVQGVTDLIETPLSLVQSLNDTLDETNAFLTELVELETTVQTLPDNLHQSFRQMVDSMEQITSYPESFAKPADKVLRDQQARQQLSTNTSAAALSGAAAAAPTTLDGFRQLGTGLMPGDAEKAKADSTLGRVVPQYTSAKAQKIQRGDTLQSLAAKFLGDARLWKNIAITNGLKPPFISDIEIRDLTRGSPLPNTLGRGDSILIPSFAKSPAAQPLLTTHGVRPEEPNEVHLLGRDFMLAEDPVTRRITIPIDVEGGAVDAKYVAGLPNLQQGIKTRLDTERGSDILYQLLGVQAVVGLTNKTIDVEAAKFRVGEAITMDPRIAALVQIEFEATGDDRLATDMTVEVRGFSEPLQLRIHTAR
jgi:hypothetical protein